MEDRNEATASGGAPRRFVYELLDFLKTAVPVCLVVLILFRVLLGLAVVVGPSMEPDFQNGNLLLMRRVGYHPDYGDVIVFDTESRGTLIKRVIGMPGDVIEIRDSTVYRNGEALQEDYIAQGAFSAGTLSGGAVTVEEGKLFVMGDNRPISADSRVADIGQVDQDSVQGGVFFRIWPFWTQPVC